MPAYQTRTAALRAAGLAVVLAALGGCGKDAPTVSGTVKFGGRPLPSGTVLYHAADGRVAHALIGEGGRYTLPDAPLGPVRITVESHPASPSGMPTRGKPPAAAGPAAPAGAGASGAVRVPARYRDPEKSGLAYAVRPGPQTHDIDLTP